MIPNAEFWRADDLKLVGIMFYRLNFKVKAKVFAEGEEWRYLRLHFKSVGTVLVAC